MWVTSGSYVGHIQVVLWVSGSIGSTGVIHFQPYQKKWAVVCSLGQGPLKMVSTFSL